MMNVNITDLIKKIMIATALMVSTTTLVQGGSCEEPCVQQCNNDCCWGNMYLSVDFLYWTAFEGGLANPCESIEINNIIEDDFTISILEGRSHFPDLNWNPGFRVGLGYQFANSNCDLIAFWTHYHSDTNGGDSLNRYHWDLDFDVVDAFYGCDCNYCSCLAFSPYLGVRYAKIDQNICKHITTTIDDVEELSITRIQQDFWGVGPLFGVIGDLGLGCGFSLYSNVAVGVLFGNFDVDSRKITELNTITYNDHLINDPHASEIVLDLGFGVRWRFCYCNDKFIVLQFGVEEHRYFNHNQFCGYGDLSLAGINFGIGVEF